MTRTWLLILGASATIGFALLMLVIVPQIMLVEIPAPEGLEPYTPEELRGREVYIANVCLYCHSHQLRDDAFTPDVLRAWGDRPNVPGDYVSDPPHLLGPMRTGPDLMNARLRPPDLTWHQTHL